MDFNSQPETSVSVRCRAQDCVHNGGGYCTLDEINVSMDAECEDYEPQDEEPGETVMGGEMPMMEEEEPAPPPPSFGGSAPKRRVPPAY